MDILDKLKNLWKNEDKDEVGASQPSPKGSDRNPYSLEEWESKRNKELLEGNIDYRAPARYMREEIATPEQIEAGTRKESDYPDYIFETRIDGLKQLIQQSNDPEEIKTYENMIKQQEDTLNKRKFGGINSLIKK